MMSKTLRKHDAVKRRVTDYFQRTSSVTIPSSPSRPPSSSSPTSLITPSSPLSFKPSSKPNQPQTRSSKKRSSVSQCMEDPISISSDSPALLSPDPPGTHITISSDADSIIVISDSAPSAVIKHTLSADGLEILSVPRKKRKREQGTPSAKTTVKRSKPVPHLFNSHCSSWRRDGGNPFSRSRHLLNRKIELDSDSEAAIIPSPYSHRSPLRPSPILPEQLQIVPCSLPINRPEGLTLKPSQAQLTLIPSKQPRLRSKASVSSMNSGNDADVEEIPSSQSDEQELIPPKYLKKDLSEVKESVEAWRQRTSEEPAEPLIIEAGPSVINTLFEDVQDVDMLDPPAPPVIGDGVVKQELEDQGSQELPQSHTPSQQITPAEHTASTEISSAPLHPLSTQGWTSLTTQPPDPHLDVETVESITLAQEYNTTQIIANIKEKAYAVVLASPSNPKGFIFDPEYLSSDESIKSLQFTAKDRSKRYVHVQQVGPNNSNPRKASISLQKVLCNKHFLLQKNIP